MKGSINIKFTPVKGEEDIACDVSVATDLYDFDVSHFCDAIATVIAQVARNGLNAWLFALSIADLAMEKIKEEEEDASECRGN